MFKPASERQVKGCHMVGYGVSQGRLGIGGFSSRRRMRRKADAKDVRSRCVSSPQPQSASPVWRVQVAAYANYDVTGTMILLVIILDPPRAPPSSSRPHSAAEPLAPSRRRGRPGCSASPPGKRLEAPEARTLEATRNSRSLERHYLYMYM